MSNIEVSDTFFYQELARRLQEEESLKARLVSCYLHLKKNDYSFLFFKNWNVLIIEPKYSYCPILQEIKLQLASIKPPPTCENGVEPPSCEGEQREVKSIQYCTARVIFKILLLLYSWATTILLINFLVGSWDKMLSHSRFYSLNSYLLLVCSVIQLVLLGRGRGRGGHFTFPLDLEIGNKLFSILIIPLRVRAWESYHSSSPHNWLHL